MCGGPPASHRKITEVSGLALGAPASARTLIASARLSPPTPRVPIRRNERLESGSRRRLDCKVTVLHEGSVLAEGSIDYVPKNEKVIDVYLGR